MVMVVKTVTMRKAAIAPAMTGVLLSPIGSVAISFVVGVAEDGTDIVPSAMVVPDDESDVVLLKLGVYDVIDGVTELAG